MTTTFDVLAEPRRREILDLLRHGERSVGDLVALLPISQPAVSKHLGVLRDAGLVSARVDAQRRIYRIEPAPLHELDDWLAPYRALWEERLDRLEDLLARKQSPADPDTDSDDDSEGSIR